MLGLLPLAAQRLILNRSVETTACLSRNAAGPHKRSQRRRVDRCSYTPARGASPHNIERPVPLVRTHGSPSTRIQLGHVPASASVSAPPPPSPCPSVSLFLSLHLSLVTVTLSVCLSLSPPPLPLRGFAPSLFCVCLSVSLSVFVSVHVIVGTNNPSRRPEPSRNNRDAAPDTHRERRALTRLEPGS